MEKALWYLLTATRGGENRLRIVRALSEQPKNANQLAEELDVGYKTVRHHLDTLEEHGLVEAGDQQYARLHFLTDRFKQHRGRFEEIAQQVDTDDRPGAAGDSG
ncbi:MAG: putative transcriptional regulator [halophilic archaeon J07HB67]|nr:MAG: putative transcriptional regulator [halophilic archaeon J07HB67]